MQALSDAKLTHFYSTVALLTLLDNAVVTGVIWLSLKLTGSAVPLGLVLCLSILIPLILERTLPSQPTQISPRKLAAIRIAAFAFVLVSSWFGVPHHVMGFLAVAMGVGIVDYFTVTVFESENARLVVGNVISPKRASKWIQTAIQLGSFGGAMAGGALLDHFGSEQFFYIIGLLGSMASLSLLFLKRAPDVVKIPASGSEHGRIATADATTEVNRRSRPLRIGANRVTALLGCIGLFGMHVGAFNSMVPVVFMQLRSWDASMFGLVSGLAGLGAFMAAAFPSLNINKIVVAVLLVACDGLMVLTTSALPVVVASFFVGYLFNHLRIVVREELLTAASTTADADWLGSRITYANLSMQSISPLAFTMLLTGGMFSIQYSPILLIGAGIAIAVATFAIPSVAPANDAAGWRSI